MQANYQQKAAFSRLSILKVGALFMETGTGKTYTAMQLIGSVPTIDYVLWICPFRTKQNTLDEINLRGGLRNLEIIGIETISMSTHEYLRIYEKVQQHNTFIVLDESIKIKNVDSKRSQRCLQLSRLCEYKLILNGTPITKNILDVWAQMEFLSPKILKMGLMQFKNTFCEYVTQTKYKGSQKITSEFITGLHNVEYLYSLIKHYVYECSLEIDTTKQYVDIPYIVESELQETYNDIKESFLNIENLMSIDNNIFLALTQKLQQSYSLSKNKLSILKDILSDYKPEKTIVFCKYVNTSKYLRTLYKDVLVLTYGKDSFGLNLQSRNVIIYFDKTFDYGLREQSMGRIYRLGQSESNCIYIDFTSDLGLCRLINDNINKKVSLVSCFKDKNIQQVLDCF